MSETRAGKRWVIGMLAKSEWSSQTVCLMTQPTSHSSKKRTFYTNKQRILNTHSVNGPPGASVGAFSSRKKNEGFARIGGPHGCSHISNVPRSQRVTRYIMDHSGSSSCALCAIHPLYSVLLNEAIHNAKCVKLGQICTKLYEFE